MCRWDCSPIASSPGCVAAAEHVRVIGTTHVRNEADVVEAFVRHNLTVLDAMTIVDHGSLDATPDILRQLVDEGLPVFVGQESAGAFDPQVLSNRLVRHVFATSDADWVVPLDADGFLKTPSRPVLREHDESVHVREAYAYIASGRPLTRGQLEAFALNDSVPMERWLPADAQELEDDPFLADFGLDYTRDGDVDPLALVLRHAERLVRSATAY